MALLQDFFETNKLLNTWVELSGSLRVGRQSASLFGKVAAQMVREGYTHDTFVSAFWVPGRIEVVGKHTDYAGGMSLFTASERGFAILVVQEPGNEIRVFDARAGDKIVVGIEGESLTFPPAIKGRWGMYLEAVLSRLSDNFRGCLKGGAVFLASNLPRAAGMSSSSALVTALFMAFRELFDLKSYEEYKGDIQTQEDLADYLGSIENGSSYKSLKGRNGVGTRGGSQDHAAIICSRQDTVKLYAYKPTRYVDEAQLPESYRFCVANSGVKAKKSGAAKAKYNLLSERVEMLCRFLRETYGTNHATLEACIRDANFSLDDTRMDLLREQEGDALHDRLMHYMQETQWIVPGALRALQSKQFIPFGKWVAQSQENSESLLGNQVPETAFLAKEALEMGAIASTAFGAGFGGSVWALVQQKNANAFRERWKASYAEAFPRRIATAAFFIDETGPAAFQLEGNDQQEII